MTLRAAAEEARAIKPRAFTLELVKGCNLRCGYCYYAQREEAYDPSTRMSPEVAERSVDLLLEEGPENEPVHIHFFGGEPLLNFSLLASTVLYGERRAGEVNKEITFEVTTNGTRLTEEVVRFLNEHRVHVGVSFDGPPEVQDVARPAAKGSSYDMAVPGIQRLLESRRGTELEAKTHCSVVVTRLAFDLVAICEHLEALGFRKIILTPATDLEGESNGISDADLPAVLAQYDRLAARYEEELASGRSVAPNWYPTLMGRLLSGERKLHFCGGGRDYLGVAADGQVNLCYRFYEDDDFSMGSVQEGIERDVTQKLLDRPLDERTACGSCWARYFCGGGCHHDNATVGGELGDPNPITCDIFRHSMGRTLEAWARLSRTGHLPRRGEPTPEALPQTLPSGASATQAAGTMTTPDSFREDDRPLPTPGCHRRDLEGEVVVYEPASHEVVVLNATAAVIYELCDGKRSAGEILAALQERFAAPEDVLRRDLATTLSELRAKHLIS